MRKQEEKLRHFLDHWTPAGGWQVITTYRLCCDNDKVLLSSLLSCKNWGSWKWGSARGMCWACELYLSRGSQQTNSVGNGESRGVHRGRPYLPCDNLSHVRNSTLMPLDLLLLLDPCFSAPSSLLDGHNFQLLHHLAATLRKCFSFSVSFLPCNAQGWVLCSRPNWPILSTLRSCYDLHQRHCTSLDVAKTVYTLWLMYQLHNTVGPGWASGQFTEKQTNGSFSHGLLPNQVYPIRYLCN